MSSIIRRRDSAPPIRSVKHTRQGYHSYGGNFTFESQIPKTQNKSSDVYRSSSFLTNTPCKSAGHNAEETKEDLHLGRIMDIRNQRDKRNENVLSFEI